MQKRVWLVVAGIGLSLGACDQSPTVPPPGEDPHVWVGELEAVGDSHLSGSVTVESTSTEFTAVIEFLGGDSSAEYAWHVGTGSSCEAEDTRVGDQEDYPLLEADEGGEAGAEATVEESLDPEEMYHVVVTSTGDQAVLACAVLELND